MEIQGHESVRISAVMDFGQLYGYAIDYGGLYGFVFSFWVFLGLILCYILYTNTNILLIKN